MATTYSTFPELVHIGGRLAPTVWPHASAAEAVAATHRLRPDAVILSAYDTSGRQRGLAPGGLSA